LKQREYFLRTGLDYDEEVHLLRILGEWGNMIGYEMGSSSIKVYIIAKASLKELSHKDKCWT
jgi:hypothetical protein